MANNFYDEGRRMLVGEGTHSALDVFADTFRILCLDAADHTTSLSADVDHADITSAGIVDTSGDITDVDDTVGSNLITVSSAAVTVATVSGDPFEQVVFYKWSGTSATSPLVTNYDTGTGLPFTPSGADVIVTPNATSGWFRI